MISIGWSEFAEKRHTPGSGYSYYQGTWEELVRIVENNWDQRKPGQGRIDLSEVVVVPVPSKGFVGGTVLVDGETELFVKMARRQPHEDSYICVEAKGKPEKIEFVNIVVYSAKSLLEDGGNRSTDKDWEIVCIVTSSVENEPMTPIAMARNFLRKPGGTFAPYTAEQFAESIYYWSKRAKSVATRKNTDNMPRTECIECWDTCLSCHMSQNRFFVTSIDQFEIERAENLHYKCKFCNSDLPRGKPRGKSQ